MAGDGVYVSGNAFDLLPGQTGEPGYEEDAFIRKYDTGGNEIWTRQFGTEFQDDTGGISVDATGVYVAGSTDGVLPGQATSGRHDAFVRKYDFDGNEVWTRQFGTSTSDSASAVLADASGVYVAGNTAGALGGDNAGTYDSFVRKYDANGHEVWTRQFGTRNFDVLLDLAKADDGVYLVGTSTVGPHTGLRDAFVRKYDNYGNEVWAHQFGTELDDWASGVSAGAGGVYVAGGTAGVLPGQTSAGGPDAFVRKYDADGIELWTRQFGAEGEEGAAGAASDGSGVYVVGEAPRGLPGEMGSGPLFVRKYDFNGTEAWTSQFGGDRVSDVSTSATGVYVAAFTLTPFHTAASHDEGDALVVKLVTDTPCPAPSPSPDPQETPTSTRMPSPTPSSSPTPCPTPNPGSGAAGQIEWLRLFGPSSSGSALALDSSGVYVGGTTRAALPGQTRVGGHDAYVRKYDSGGAEMWTRQFGTATDDVVSEVSAQRGAVYVTGYTEGTFAGQSIGGELDGYVRKYDIEGNELWTRQFGTAEWEYAFDVSADVGGVYVVGVTGGALSGEASLGWGDIYIRKYDVDGNELWTRQFGTASSDWAEAVAADSSGVYVAGRIEHGALPGQTSAGGPDGFVRKYDANGNEVWTRQFDNAGILDVSADASAVSVVGTQFMTRYDSSGNEVWTRLLSTAPFHRILGASVDASGVLLAGDVRDTDPPIADDALVRRYDNNGDEAWTTRVSSRNGDSAESVLAAGDVVYVSGITEGIFPCYPGGEGGNVFLARLTNPTQVPLDTPSPSPSPPPSPTPSSSPGPSPTPTPTASPQPSTSPSPSLSLSPSPSPSPAPAALGASSAPVLPAALPRTGGPPGG